MRQRRWSSVVMAALAAAPLLVQVALGRGGEASGAGDPQGYWLVDRTGAVTALGSARALGSADASPLNEPVVCMASSPSGGGYWLAARDGGVFAYGDARFLGSAGDRGLEAPVVGLAVDRSGNGYWLVAGDGGVFAYGDAGFVGSMGGRGLAAPIVGVASSPSGRGYWLVGADGGVFAFGDARFLGSLAGQAAAPVVGIVPTATGGGYWLVAGDGGIFAFGDALFFGSLGGRPLNAAIVGMTPTAAGRGYWLAGADGGTFAFGDARFLGSRAGSDAAAVAGIAAPGLPGSCHGGAPVVAAAGDIACEPGRPTTPTECHQAATAALVRSRHPDAALTLGDNQYEDGAADTFRASFGPSWGALGVPIHPAAGNHEFGVPGAAGYFGYFGAAAGEPGRGWYSFDLGAWHLIALDSNCAAVGGCGPGSAQTRWLAADLAAHRPACTLAYFHHPRFSSGPHGDDPDVAPLWQTLSDAGADVVLTGHDHLYERFAPLDPSGQPDPSGLPEFVVGTGGRSLYPIVHVHTGSQMRRAGTFGVLFLTLDPGGYGWQFRDESGAVLDAGRAACR